MKKIINKEMVGILTEEGKFIKKSFLNKKGVFKLIPILDNSAVLVKLKLVTGVGFVINSVERVLSGEIYWVETTSFN